MVYEAFLGGHVLSAVTIARQMLSRGHEPVFVGKEGRMTPIIEQEMKFEKLDIPVFHGDRPTYFTWDSWQAVTDLRRIIRTNSIDLIHTFDARSYFHCHPAATMENIPIVGTLCGGTDPTYNLPRAPKIMVFSEEQKAKMVESFKWKPERVDVIRTRLDLQLSLIHI